MAFSYPGITTGENAAQKWQASQDGLLSLVSLNPATGSFPTPEYDWQLCARTDLGMLYQWHPVAEAWIELLPLGAPAARRVLLVYAGAITATLSRFVPPYGGGDYRIDALTLLSDDAVASSGTDHWTFQLYNRTQADATLFATAPTTNGSAVTANTVWRKATDQNKTITADDCVELVVTKAASAPDMDHALVCVEAQLLG